LSGGTFSDAYTTDWLPDCNSDRAVVGGCFIACEDARRAAEEEDEDFLQKQKRFGGTGDFTVAK